MIGRYDAQAFTDPASVVVHVPYAAKTDSTRIHWWQPASEHSSRVDWALDQVNTSTKEVMYSSALVSLFVWTLSLFADVNPTSWDTTLLVFTNFDKNFFRHYNQK